MEGQKIRDRNERRSYAGETVEYDAEDAWLIPQYNVEEADSSSRERGVVRSTKPSYGFIRSSQRDDRLFYHITEYQVEGDVLMPGDNVEFSVVRNHVSNQLNAVRISKLERGTVAFEDFSDVEEHGYVEYVKARPPKAERIYEEIYGYVKPKGGGESLPFRYEDVQDRTSLAKGDMVLFTLAVDKRSKEKAARRIKLVEKAALKKQDEESETSETVDDGRRFTGVVKSLKETFGFVYCPEREERLFFHITEVQNMGQLLRPGVEVEFSVRWNEANRSFNAVNVVIGASPQRGSPGGNAGRQTGTVSAIKGTYGFIRYHAVRMRSRVASDSRAMSRDREIYFRLADLPTGVKLEVGDEVEFQVDINSRSGERSATMLRCTGRKDTNRLDSINNSATAASPPAALRPRIASDRVFVRPRGSSSEAGESPSGLTVAMARGPDGTRGFGAGRGKGVTGASTPSPQANNSSSPAQDSRPANIVRRREREGLPGGTPPRIPNRDSAPTGAHRGRQQQSRQRESPFNGERGGPRTMRDRHRSA